MQGSPESLRWRFLSEADAERLYEHNPELQASPDRYCPTCHKTGFYLWKGYQVECDCQLQLQLHKHYLNAGIGTSYQRMSWDDYEGDDKARELCEQYYESRVNLINGGTGLMFLGDFGTGKTMTMNLLLKQLLWDKYDVYATTFTSMIEMFTAGWKSMEDQALFQKKVKQSKVLLFDDIGKEMRTRNNLSESTFDDVLRSRVQDGRPTFITSNMTIEEMGQGYGSAIFSLLREVSIVCEFKGDDFREKSSKRLLDEAISGVVRPIQ